MSKIRRHPLRYDTYGRHSLAKTTTIIRELFILTPDGTPYDATKFGPVCLQTNYSASVKKQRSQQAFGEDCLWLNIWTPVEKPDETSPKWPEESTDPTELISTGRLNAVFVSVGYRLNVFGFLAGNALREESGGKEVGNYGLWDQRLAMEWAYKNISAFGGDPENITLSGHSAGAYAVQAQALYDSRGTLDKSARSRFQRLVMFSNAIPTQSKTPEESQPLFDELSE